MQLQQIRLERFDHLLELFVAGIDGKRDLEGSAAYALPQSAGSRKLDVARGRSKENEADHVGAAVERHIEHLRRFQPTNFDQEGHVSVRSISSIRLCAVALMGPRSSAIVSATMRKSICQ